MAKITEKFLEHDGTIEEGSSTGQVSVKLNGTTLSKTGDAGIFVANSGITATQLASTVAGDGLTGGAGTALAVGAGTHITVGATSVSVNGSSLVGSTSAITYTGGVLTISRGNGLVKTGNSIVIGQGSYITVNANDIAVNIDTLGTQLAGAGLGYNSTTDTLNVNLTGGKGISATGATVALADGALSADWDISAGSTTILVPTPTSNNHVANKGYVDSVAQGLDVKQSCDYTTTANFTITTTVVAQVQTALDQVGGSAPTLVVGDRILVKDQTTGSQNGIYVVVNISGDTVLQRATDADSSAKVTSGMFTFIEKGDLYHDSGWVLSTEDPITLDTTSLSFVQFSGAGSILAGNGLTKTGNTLSVVGSTYIEVDSGSVVLPIDKLGTQLAGDGLSYDSGTDTLNVNANGYGLRTQSDSLRIVVGNGLQVGSTGTNTDAVSLGALTSDWNTDSDGGSKYNIKGLADPVDPADATTRSWVLEQISGTTTFMVENFTLDETDITNKYVTLPQIPNPADETILIVKHAPGQHYGDDYNIVSTNRLSWSGLALDGVLAVGDKITVLYKV